MRPAREQPSATPVDDLEDLFENAPCGYLSADKDGRIGRANATLARWIGVEPAALAGKRFSDLLTIGGKLYYETHLAPLLRMQGAFSEVALDLACVDGRKLPTLVNAVERRDAAGAPLFIRMTVFAAAERRRYERNLSVAKSSAEAAAALERTTAELREQFIAILGHDLRNPLASIASGVHILRGEALSPRGRQVLGLMEGSVVRASSLIGNVMDFARARLAGGLSVALDVARPIAPIIEQVIGEARAIACDRTISARLEIDAPVHADPDRIGQLLSNLLGNALTHGTPDCAIEVFAGTRDGVFELSVTNGGEPIPPDAMADLFHPFVRGQGGADRQGLGLGLHIASEIAKAHGGAMAVASDRDGTRFSFTMPLTQQSARDDD